MASFSLRNLFGRRQTTAAVARPPEREIVVGAKADQDTSLTAFDNSTITYSSDLASTHYDSLLRNKQSNINTLYQ